MRYRMLLAIAAVADGYVDVHLAVRRGDDDRPH